MRRDGARTAPVHVRTVRRITAALAVLGALLLALHVAGRFVPLRNPAVYTEANHFPDDITLTYAEAKAQLVRRPGEARGDFAVRATDVVNRGMAHYWRDDGAVRFHVHVPPWENYFLWALGWIDPAGYGKWEFADDDKALERGVGLCSQQAIILVRALRRAGVPAAIVGLSGHVVATAAVGPGALILLDPDYGVVVPHSLAEVQRDPDLVRPYYAAKYPPRQVDLLVGIYGPEGNFVDPTGADAYTAGRRRKEAWTYTACWVLPLVLMVPYGAVAAIGAVRRRRKPPPA